MYDGNSSRWQATNDASASGSRDRRIADRRRARQCGRKVSTGAAKVQVGQLAAKLLSFSRGLQPRRRV